MALLRAELLGGRGIAAAGPLRDGLRRSLEDLGARVEPFDHELDEDAAQAWARANAPLHGLVYDAAAPFGTGGREALLAASERGWPAIRAVATGALIPAGAGGRIVLIAPTTAFGRGAPDASTHVEAARATLENITRTLSIEWARYAITATAIAPATRTAEVDLATLVGFLLSPAGDYFSGCRFELGSVG